MKRWCKRPPREAQATRHGKPHRVQGQIGNPGAARSCSAKADGFRVSAAQTNDSLRSQGRRQNSAYSPSKTTSICKLRFTICESRSNQSNCTLLERSADGSSACCEFRNSRASRPCSVFFAPLIVNDLFAQPVHSRCGLWRWCRRWWCPRRRWRRDFLNGGGRTDISKAIDGAD